MNDFDWRGGVRAAHALYFVITSAACLASSCTGKLFDGVLPFGGWVLVTVLWALVADRVERPERVAYVTVDEEVPE